MPASKHTRYRDWCFTDYNLDAEWLKGLPTQYICWGEEVAPTTGRAHLQGFLSLSHEQTFDEVKAMVNIDDEAKAALKKAKKKQWMPIHVERRKGTISQAIDYTKGGGDKPVNLIWFEQGVVPADDPKEQGKRTDMEFARDMVKTGMSLREFGELCRGQQALKLYRDLLSIYEVPRVKPPYVVWLWGDTMSGKTSHAKAIFAKHNMFLEDRTLHQQRLDEHHWEGYDAQKGIFLDEFEDTAYSYKFMLQLLHEPCVVRMLYGSRQILAEIIVISANKPPHLCYEWLANSVNNGIGHLLRRIDQVVHHKNSFAKCVKDMRPMEKEYDGIPIEIQDKQAPTFIPQGHEVNEGSPKADTCH
jgi:hypothetical protein